MSSPTSPDSAAPQQRVCFTLQVRPDRLTEYRRAHEDVWPDMLAALRESGWKNYSLHLRDDGLLVGVVETDDFDRAQARIGELPIHDRWQHHMADYFVAATTADRALDVLPEVFHLD